MKTRVQILLVNAAACAVVATLAGPAAMRAATPAVPTVAQSAGQTASNGPAAGLDTVLDLYVRDGFVYYRALKSDRVRLDRHVAALASASLDGRSREDQIAFWLNAYNALVLRTVIDHYPITQQRSKEYPARSLRQVPGAFERTPHRVAGRTLTLDQIETTVLSQFDDPRLYLALGRGAVGGGRLRSEAFSAAALDRQLGEVATECTRRAQCVEIDRINNRIRATPIFSWREEAFTGAYTDRANARFSARSPIERAILAFIEPSLLTTEREFVEKNAFAMEFAPFDWTLNDLTGRGGR
jgi:hypothetical protein